MRRLSSRRLFSTTAILALASSGCGDTATMKADNVAGAMLARVELVKPARATIRRATEQPGQIDAYEVTPLFAKVSGYVNNWNVDIGARVKKGQVLAVLRVPELDAEADQKQATVEEAEAKLAQARASEEVARADLVSAQAKRAEVLAGTKRADGDLARWQAEFKRVEQLFHERVQTGTLLDETRSKLQAAESAREELHAQVASAEAAVKQSVALLDRARADVTAAAATIKVARLDVARVQALRAYETIVAPYDGVVTHRDVDVGDLTEPGIQGRPLFVVARDDIVRISVNVPEMYATEVNAGDPVLVRLQALAGRRFEGKVTRTSWMLDARNRTLRTEVDVANPNGILRPGLYAYATVVVDEHADVLSVPTSALVRQDSQAWCVVVANGRAERRPVVVGLNDAASVEISSGLRGDESVVKAFASSLTDGQAVTVVVPEATKGKP
jgi:RND family efflux transporter MFP subunit